LFLMLPLSIQGTYLFHFNLDYEINYAKVLREMKAMLVLFTVEHLVMCFPIFILCAKIHQRNQYLDTMYGQLSEEQVIIINIVLN
jgi:hypothetical protein